MKHKTALDHLKQEFAFLFEDGGFVIASWTEFESFGNWVAVLESSICRMRVLQDRGEISLAIGPLWDPRGWQAGPWYSVQVLLEYLSGSDGDWKGLLGVGTAEGQLARMANLLQKHIRQMCAIFMPGTFSQHRERLDRLREDVEKRRWADLGIEQS